MLLVAYTSTATFDFLDGDLISLLMKSRADNKRTGLTGLLLYSDGTFIQVLEGPDDQVNAKFDTIADDPPHDHVTLLYREQIQERQFPKWTMGYETLSDPLVTLIPGYDKFFQNARSNIVGPVKALIDQFRDDTART
jgi:hypothetical protein